MKQVQDIIYGLLSDFCNIDLQEDTNIFHAGIDSLNIIHFIMKIEEIFKFKFTDDELELTNFKTPVSIILLVKGKIVKECSE